MLFKYRTININNIFYSFSNALYVNGLAKNMLICIFKNMCKQLNTFVSSILNF